MRATGYLQIVPERTSGGETRGLSIQRVTQKHPRDPLPGALVIKVAIDVPDGLAKVQTVEAAAEAGMLTLVLEPDEVA